MTRSLHEYSVRTNGVKPEVPYQHRLPSRLPTTTLPQQQLLIEDPTRYFLRDEAEQLAGRVIDLLKKLRE